MKPFGLSGEIDLKVKVKLQLKLMIPPTPWPGGCLTGGPCSSGKQAGSSSGTSGDHWSPVGQARAGQA